MKPFSDACRFDYPLNKNSVVLDCGGYEGNFAYQIHDKFECRVIVFEPINKFYKSIRTNDKISSHNIGVGGHTRDMLFSIQGDMSGAFVECNEPEKVHVVSIKLISDLVGFVDLIKLNIEGMEYEVLESMIDNGIVSRFKNIQVQFHRIPNSENIIPKIRERLSKTHFLTYGDDYIFENWELKQ